MKFLANENFPIPSVKLLQDNGLDVICVQDAKPSISDKDVLLWALDTDRIILTSDKDYGEIVFRNKLACPVVFFRKKGDKPTDAAHELLALVNKIDLSKKFTVIDETGIRQRELNF